MAKVLKVIDPFLRLDFGDTFKIAENGEDYIASVSEDFTDTSDDGKEYTTKYQANFTISKDYANQMIKDGYLEEVGVEKKPEPFVNVFSEIDRLIEKYSADLTGIDEDMPECLKLEQTTVLHNLITVLEHLKSLRKN